MIISKRVNETPHYIFEHYDFHVNDRYYDIIFRNGKFSAIFFESNGHHPIAYMRYTFDHAANMPEIKNNVLKDFDIENFNGLIERALCIVSKYNIFSGLNEDFNPTQKQRRKI